MQGTFQKKTVLWPAFKWRLVLPKWWHVTVLDAQFATISSRILHSHRQPWSLVFHSSCTSETTCYDHWTLLSCSSLWLPLHSESCLYLCQLPGTTSFNVGHRGWHFSSMSNGIQRLNTGDKQNDTFQNISKYWILNRTYQFRLLIHNEHWFNGMLCWIQNTRSSCSTIPLL